MKKGQKVLIIHFRSAVDYPPVYNLARYLAGKGVKVTLLNGRRKDSTKGLENFGVSVSEVDMTARSGLKSYRAYGLFYFKAFMALVKSPGTPIIYFESISCPPVFLYFLLFPFSRRKLAIHFHEFFDREEHRKQSFLERFGRSLEPFLFKKAHWISHTNQDRLDRFSLEFPRIEKEKLQVMPNYPPESWLLDKTKDLVKNDGKIRLVYVGSVSFEGLYLKELVEWLRARNGAFTCDVYSKNVDEKIDSYFKEQGAGLISYKGSLYYDEIPGKLQHYDVGLILYNGIGSSNVVYSAPNKLFEYLACGLDVWFSKDLISSYGFETHGTYPKVIKVDFGRFFEFDYRSALTRDGYVYKKSDFTMESVNQQLYNVILNSSEQ